MRAPASGQPTRQFALDNHCTLEVKITQDGGSSYVAAREFGIQWVDGSITGGRFQGCGSWILTGIFVETDEGTNDCSCYRGVDDLYPPPGPGCTSYAPDWYQAAQAGALVRAKVSACQTATPPYSYDCAYRTIAVYP